ncbi:MAG: oligosaccharide flippase family protein [Alphaproteobacteria bacterium]|nr:oligosaccharide flippase family protein [Alphaproteobacteria bacterium]
MRPRWLAWSALDSLGSTLLAMAVTIAIARELGAMEFGRYAMALGLVQLAGVLPEALLHDAVVQRERLAPLHVDTALWTVTGLGVVAAALLIAGASPLAAMVGDATLAPMIAALALALPVTAASAIAQAVLRRALMFDRIATSSLIGRVSGALIGLAVLGITASPAALVCQQLGAAAVTCVLLLFAAPRFRLRASLAALRELLPFGIQTMLGSALWMTTTRLFTVQLGLALGPVALGLFNLALRFVDMLRDALFGAASRIALPVLAREQGNRGAFIALYARYTELGSLALLPVFGGLCMTADALVGLLFGDAWRPAVPVIQLLSLGVMVSLTRLFAATAISAWGRPAVNLAAVAASFVTMNGGMWLFADAGLVAAALCWISRYVVTLACTVVALHRMLDLRWADQLRLAVGPLVATLTMMGGVLGFDLLARPDLGPLQRLVTMIVVGVVVYIAAIGLVARATLRKLLERRRS